MREKYVGDLIHLIDNKIIALILTLQLILIDAHFSAHSNSKAPRSNI
jgi:hypothetical protein